MTRGRRPKNVVPLKYCTYCEGTKYHWGKECPACDGSGMSRVQKVLQKAYDIKHGILFRNKK